MIIFWLVILVISLVVLVKSADYFTEYSEKLGLALGLSSFVIGVTIVALGTSLPELISSLYAVISTGNNEFVADTIIGSNIANALLVLGVGAVYVKTLKVKTSLIDVDLPFFFMSMGVFTFFAWDGNITMQEGMLLLAFLIIFVIYSVKSSNEDEVIKEDKEEIADLSKQFKDKNVVKGKSSTWKYLLVILASGAGIAISAKYLVDSVLTLSELFNISSSFLTITVVALGTSLPEIFTSIAALKMGNHGLVIGNVFGSNTYNLLLVGGLPAMFGTLQLSELSLTIGLPFLIFATFVVIFTTIDNQVRFWEGAAMLLLYIVFMFRIAGLV